MAFQCLENIIILFLQILMSLLNLLIHGVIADETASSLESDRQQRNNKIDFEFCYNNRANNKHGYRCHKHVNSETKINHRVNFNDQKATDLTVDQMPDIKENNARNRSALAYKNQHSVISKIDACLSKTRSAPLLQSSFQEFLENKSDHLEERGTSKPLSGEHSTMINNTNSNILSEIEQTAKATIACYDLEGSHALLHFPGNSVQSTNCSKHETPKNKTKFVSTRSLMNNQDDEVLCNECVENRVTDQPENYFTYNEGEIHDGDQSEQQSLPLTMTSDDEKNSTFTALYNKTEELTDTFITHRSELSNSITDLDKNENSDSLTTSFKMKLPFEIIEADHPRTSLNDTVGEHIKYIDSSGYTFKDVSTEEYPGTNQENDPDVPTPESAEQKRVKHRWRKYGNPNENPDLIRDRIYALKREEHRRKCIANKENQSYDSGIDERCTVDHVSASSARWNTTGGEAGTPDNGGQQANRYPQQRTWDKLQSKEIGQLDCRLKDNFCTAANATGEERNFLGRGNGASNMNAIEFLMNLQHQRDKHMVTEFTGEEHRLASSVYLEDDAIIAMSRCGTGNQYKHERTWADLHIGNISSNSETPIRHNNKYADGTSLAWTGYNRSADDRSSQRASPVNGSSYRFDADYGLNEQDQARPMQFEGTEYRKIPEKTDSYVKDDIGQYDHHIRSRTNPVTSEESADNSIPNKRIKHRWRKYGNPNENPNLVRDRIYALRRREKDQRHNRSSN